MQEIVSHFLELCRLIQIDSQFQYMIDDFYINEIGTDIGKTKAFQNELVRQKKKQDKLNKRYMYMLTFTLDPKKNDFSDKFYDDVEAYIIKFFNSSKQLLCTRIEYVREGGDDDHKHVHWHFGVISKNYIEKKVFKTYIKNFGSIDVSTSKCNNFKDILIYINKSKNSTVLL